MWPSPPRPNLWAWLYHFELSARERSRQDNATPSAAQIQPLPCILQSKTEDSIAEGLSKQCRPHYPIIVRQNSDGDVSFCQRLEWIFIFQRGRKTPVFIRLKITPKYGYFTWCQPQILRMSPTLVLRCASIPFLLRFTNLIFGVDRRATKSLKQCERDGNREGSLNDLSTLLIKTSSLLVSWWAQQADRVVFDCSNLFLGSGGLIRRLRASFLVIARKVNICAQLIRWVGMLVRPPTSLQSEFLYPNLILLSFSLHSPELVLKISCVSIVLVNKKLDLDIVVKDRDFCIWSL